MQIADDGFLHLTYCTNIHPADGWPAVFDTLQRFAPALKQRLSPSRPFGLGLRLSARDARELLEGDRLSALRAYLDEHGLYVALINGFPYGAFHGTPVKATVYAPDWRDDARVAYTLDLLTILRRLVPDGLDGGISTAPLSYKPWLRSPGRDSRTGTATHAEWTTMTNNVVRVVEQMVRVHQEDGRIIHLDIEPEPDCLIEHTDEAIAFFEQWLLPVGGLTLAASVGVSEAEARRLLLDHVRVCFDCCHSAVEFEDPVAALARLARAGIRVGRVQLSSALRVTFPSDPVEAAQLADRLRPFANSTYLHQVIAQRHDEQRQFPDLPDALQDDAPRDGAQWRIHFHVPLFASEYDGLRSTQGHVAMVIGEAIGQRFTRHLEIETYTWDVIPEAFRAGDAVSAIAREIAWTRGELERAAAPAASRGPAGAP